MRRGEVYWVDLDPARGNEANKTRPAVIVSSDAANRTAERLGRGVVSVVPLTSNTTRVHPFQVLISRTESGLKNTSKAHAEQVRSVSVQRLGRRAGAIPPHVMADVDQALRLHLDL